MVVEITQCTGLLYVMLVPSRFLITYARCQPYGHASELGSLTPTRSDELCEYCRLCVSVEATHNALGQGRRAH